MIASEAHQEGTPFSTSQLASFLNDSNLCVMAVAGEVTLLTCGVLSFDHVAGQKLVSQLPQFIHMKNENGRLPGQLQPLIELMAEKQRLWVRAAKPWWAHLADIIVIQAIRYWVEHAQDASKGWIGALKDPKIGKALAVIHAKPESIWTVDRLAEHVGMSRSGFSARFTEVIGTSVKQLCDRMAHELGPDENHAVPCDLG